MPDVWARSWRFATSTTTDCDKAAQRYPDAKKFYDFRDLFDEMSGQIDAVTVSTADHTHAPAAVRAMKEGKAVFCQKPLTHSLWEARRMAEVARETKVATQMGNQGTASKVLRRSAAMVQAGVLGPVHEIHAWTNRPIWPQGGPRPESKPVPKNLHWNAVAGARAERDYADGYPPFAWRGSGILEPARRRHGLPHDEHAFHGARPARPGVGDGRDLGPQQAKLSELVDHSV